MGTGGAQRVYGYLVSRLTISAFRTLGPCSGHVAGAS
jgi:hypothetical protein